MIEVVYNEKAEMKEEEKTINKPKNIKQIGAGNSRFKIYMEDYVLSYIKRAPRQEEAVKYGLLLGELKRGEGNTYIFIRGIAEAAVQGKKVEWTEEIWSSLYEDVNKYFDKLQIVGWFASLPFVNDGVMAELNHMQYAHFAGTDKILFLVDRTEADEKFFRHNGIALQEIEGYYVYFERNEEMQAYMTAKGSGTPPVKEREERKIRHGALGNNLKWNRKLSAVSVMVTAALLALVILMGNYGKIRNAGQAGAEPEGSSGKGVKVEYIDPKDEEKLEAGGTVLNSPENEKNENSGSNGNNGTGENNENIDRQTDANGGDSESVTAANSLVPARYYTVQKGDTLYQICMEVYKSAAMVEIVREMNGIGEDYVIREGEKILLP